MPCRDALCRAEWTFRDVITTLVTWLHGVPLFLLYTILVVWYFISVQPPKSPAMGISLVTSWPWEVWRMEGQSWTFDLWRARPLLTILDLAISIKRESEGTGDTFISNVTVVIWWCLWISPNSIHLYNMYSKWHQSKTGDYILLRFKL